MKSIAEEWADYVKTCYPNGVGDQQRTETQKAFYAGFFTCLCQMKEIGEESVPEDAGVLQMEMLWQETQEFFRGK